VSDDKRAARDRFGWIQRVTRDLELHPNGRLLAIVIADFINTKSGIAFPSQATLANILGLSTRTIVNLLPQIVARGHLEIAPGNGRGHASEYRLKGEADFTLKIDKGCNGLHPSKPQRVKSDALKGEIRRQKRVKPVSPQPVEKNQLREPVIQNRDFFAEFWEAYPKRKSKPHAQKAFAKALKVATAQQIIAGAERYAVERQGKDATYTKHPASWLNAHSWEDDPEPSGRPMSLRTASALQGAFAGLGASGGEHDLD